MVLQTCSEIYEPSYFTRIGLRYRDIANRTYLPHMKKGVETFIPEHIFSGIIYPYSSRYQKFRKSISIQ